MRRGPLCVRVRRTTNHDERPTSVLKRRVLPSCPFHGRDRRSTNNGGGPGPAGSRAVLRSSARAWQGSAAGSWAPPAPCRLRLQAGPGRPRIPRLHLELPGEKGHLQREVLHQLADRPPAGVAGLGVVEEQHREARRGGGLHPGRHLAGPERRHARVGVARREEDGRAGGAGYTFWYGE